MEVSKVSVYWQDFYQKHFGIRVNLCNLKIPEKQGEFSWPIITLGEINEQIIYNRCKKLFPCDFIHFYYCSYGVKELLNEVLEPDITTKGIHIAFFRDRREADEELRNLSADDLKERNIKGITLKQRLVMELDYFTRTGGRHLDINSVTLCSGSCIKQEKVRFRVAPNVDWHSGKLRIGNCFVRRPFLCSRQVVFI